MVTCFCNSDAAIGSVFSRSREAATFVLKVLCASVKSVLFFFGSLTIAGASVVDKSKRERSEKREERDDLRCYSFYN